MFKLILGFCPCTHTPTPSTFSFVSICLLIRLVLHSLALEVIASHIQIHSKNEKVKQSGPLRSKNVRTFAGVFKYWLLSNRVTQSLVGGRRDFASCLLTQILGLFLLQAGKVVILRVFQDISLSNLWKEKLYFPWALEERNLYPVFR